MKRERGLGVCPIPFLSYGTTLRYEKSEMRRRRQFAVYLETAVTVTGGEPTSAGHARARPANARACDFIAPVPPLAPPTRTLPSCMTVRVTVTVAVPISAG